MKRLINKIFKKRERKEKKEKIYTAYFTYSTCPICEGLGRRSFTDEEDCYFCLGEGQVSHLKFKRVKQKNLGREKWNF